MPHAMIELRDVWKAFGGQPVLCGVNLTVEEGTTSVLLGASASGKSVLLKHVLGLMKPDRGVVKVDGEDLAELGEAGLARVHRKLGILFQGGALFDSMSVFDNVAFPLRERAHLPPHEVNERVGEILKLLELSEAAALLPGELSGGMLKRAAFARAVVEYPKLLLCDDPTAGLDPVTTAIVDEELKFVRAKFGVTLLLITQDLPTAFQLADTISLLHEGRIVGFGTPEEFAHSPEPAVQRFLREWRELREAASHPHPA